MNSIKRLEPIAPWTQETLASEKFKAGQSGSTSGSSVRLQLKKEFLSMDKVVDRLYIVGLYGLTQENLDKHQITHAINCNDNCANIRGIECIRIDVS